MNCVYISAAMVFCSNNKICSSLSKGSTLVLVWSALLNSSGVLFLNVLFSEGGFLSANPGSDASRSFQILFISTLVAKIFNLLLFPLAGLIAETLMTRYKVMMLGTLIAIAGLFVLVIGEIGLVNLNMKLYYEGIPWYYNVFIIIGFTLHNVGMVLFQANALQFGVDQLPFESNSEIAKFVLWYFWTLFAFENGLLSIIPLVFFHISKIAPYVFICLALIPALSLLCNVISFFLSLTFRRHLLTQPVSHKNPVKLIFRVINYTRRHSKPVNPSAFTFGEPLPPRLDHGKQRYGGPFTTEQVEDVKMFWRILIIMILLMGTVLSDGMYDTTQVQVMFDQFVHDWSKPEKKDKDMLNVLAFQVPFACVIVLGIPLYVFVLEPIVSRCCKKHIINMLKLMGYGQLLLVISLVLTTISNKLIQDVSYSKAGITCFNYNDTNFAGYNYNSSSYNSSYNSSSYNSSSQSEVSTIDIEVSLSFISQIISAIGYLLVYPTMLKFILAQGPCNMQGLLIGLWYAYHSIQVIIELIVAVNLKPSNCSYWHYVVQSVCAAISLLLYAFISKRFKYRQREDRATVNYQAIIEEYTERVLTRAANSNNEHAQDVNNLKCQLC